MEIGPPKCDVDNISCIILIAFANIYCISLYVSDIVFSAFHVFS